MIKRQLSDKVMFEHILETKSTDRAEQVKTPGEGSQWVSGSES